MYLANNNSLAIVQINIISCMLQDHESNLRWQYWGNETMWHYASNLYHSMFDPSSKEPPGFQPTAIGKQPLSQKLNLRSSYNIVFLFYRIETLYEDFQFKERRLAALVASKVIILDCFL